MSTIQHNQFLNPNKNKQEAIKERASIFRTIQHKKLSKIIKMLSTFNVPKENIEYIKEHFYSDEV